MPDLCYLELLQEKPITICPQPGGISNIFYVGNVGNIASYTRDVTTKAIATLVMKQGKRLWKYAGRVKQNTAGSEGQATENGVTFNQSITMLFDYLTQLDMDAIEAYVKSQNLFVIYLSNKGQYKVAGLNKDPEQKNLFSGLSHVSSSFPEGTAATDSSGATVVMGGILNNNPVIFRVGLTLLTTESYLEAALTPAV